MEDDSRISVRPLLLLAAVIAAVMFVFPLAIRFPLLDPDEGLHASIAQEMLERGDFVMPHFIGRPFLDKPIFYFWVQAASLGLLGTSETAVRLPGLMFGLLGAATTALLAWRMFDRAVGLIAGILYATTILPTALAQAASHDVALIPWVNLTILLLWEWLPKHGAAARGCAARVACVLAAGFFLGLSILTKGLMGMAVVGIACGGCLLCRWGAIRLPLCYSDPKRQRGSSGACSSADAIPRLRFSWVFGGALLTLLVASLVAAPWYLAIETRNSGFIRYYIFSRHLLGLASDSQPHSNQPWWYYLPVLLGGGLPWIGYIVWGTAGKRSGEFQGPKSEVRNLKIPKSPSFQVSFPASPSSRSSSAVLLLWCWLIGWTAFLTAAQVKLATYLWPAFPPLAILAALAWAKLIDGALSNAARRSFARTFVWSSWSGPIVLPAAVLVVQWVYAVRFGWAVWAAVGVAAAMSPLPIIPWRAGWRQGSLAAAALSLAAQFVVVMAFALPPVAEACSARELAEHFNRLGRLPARLLVAEERIGSLVFYLAPRLRAGLKQGQLDCLPRDRPPRLQPGDVLAIREQNLSRASTYLDLGALQCERVGQYRLYRVIPPLAP